MKFNLNDMQNFDINKSMKYIIFLSFVTQWSFLSMIINLFTLGIFRIPLFIIMIIDALTMIRNDSKTIKRPSWILSRIWDLIDIFTNNRNSQGYYNSNKNNSIYNAFNNISNNINNFSNKIKNIFNNLKEEKLSSKKYDKERELNKFSNEIGKKITVEYTSENNKLKKKSFKYKDRASTYINMLESKGYKNYTKYNLDATNSLTYIIFNKDKDIVDLTSNKIQLSHKNTEYKFVTDGWPSI